MAVSTESQYQENQDGSFPKARHVFGLMGFLGFAILYSMRVNLSVAIVMMVNQTAIPRSSKTTDELTCAMVNQSLTSKTFSSSHHQGEFIWDEATQGIILGSFYYGYIISQIPSGRFAEMYGGKMIFGLGVVACSVFTIATPFAARWSGWAMIGVRFITGLCEGVTFPAIYVMILHWVPPLERSSFSAMVYCGSNIGTFIAMPLVGFLCNMTFLDGWPLAFYVTGILGFVWFIFWMILVYEWPSSHPRISSDELKFIEQSVILKQHDHNRQERTPWLSFLTCVPFLAITVTQFGWSFAYFTLMSELPTYMSEILNFDIQSNSALSGLPYLTSYFVTVVCCWLSEVMLRKNIITLVNSYRLWNSIATIVPALGLIGVVLVGCNGMLVIFFLAVLGAFGGNVFASIHLNYINLSPKYAATMFSINNALVCMTGFIGPLVTGLIINGNNTLSQWRYVFYLTAGLGIVGNIFYLIFVSTEEQSWSKISRNS